MRSKISGLFLERVLMKITRQCKMQKLLDWVTLNQKQVFLIVLNINIPILNQGKAVSISLPCP